MAIPTVQVTGSVVDPDAIGVTGGTIVVSLSQPGSAMDGTVSRRVGGAAKWTLDASGNLPATALLVPNDVITPSGTAYRAQFSVVLASGARANWQETWQLASAPNPIAIGAILRVATSGAAFVAGPQGVPGPTFYDIMLSWIGRPVASEVLSRVVVANAFTVPVGATGSRASAGVLPTAAFVVTVQKNGSPVATVSIATGGVATWTCAAPVALAAGDVVAFVGPAVADATVADLAITLTGTP